ncbi:MAG: putative glycoside hydrolase [Patescibacteria group bacterium]|nr:putative glycoside hydrolase [Patescibacteria group bacterium]
MGPIFVIIFQLLMIYSSIFSYLGFEPNLTTKPKDIQTKAIYITAYSASERGLLKGLVDLVDKTELNAVVIDVKDYTGRIFIHSENADAIKIGSYKPLIKDIKGIVSDLKKKGIYTIARVAVFQDPYLAEKVDGYALKTKSGKVWRDFKGLSWVDSSKKEVWDYNISIAVAASKIGFDEINFDYIRFPSDGNISEIDFPFQAVGKTKNEAMKDFFVYLSRKMSYLPVRTSVDLFGMTLWRDDGLGIGQRFSDAVGRFDYICPMVYPSHYPDNFEGFANPADYPYEIVYNSLDKSKKFLSGSMTKVRPWIQDFDLGADYDSVKVRKQIQAAYDSGSDGWLLWNASNRYTAEALLPAVR